MSLSLFGLLLAAHFEPALLSQLLFLPAADAVSPVLLTLLRLLLSFATYLALLEAFAYSVTLLGKLASPTTATSPAHVCSLARSLVIQGCALATAVALTNLPTLALRGYGLHLQILALGLTAVVGALLVMDALKGDVRDAEAAEVEDEEMSTGFASGFHAVEFRRAAKWEEC